MRHHLLLTRLLLIALFAFPSLRSIAQNSAIIQMKGTKMRAPLEVNAGESEITLNGLTPGNTYLVKTARAAQGQPVEFELIPDKSVSPTQTDMQPQGKNTLRFTAATETAHFRVRANTVQKVTTVPMFLSVGCISCTTDPAAKDESSAEFLSNLHVTPNISAQSLITNTLIGGDCFTVSNVTSSGSSLARGTFTNGDTNIGLSTGMVMSTGRIDILPGPNNLEGANGGFGTQGFDPDLASLVDGELSDINIIEFDFTPTANTVQFDFVFGSEEYCEYVNTEFNDVFGFFISGPGIAGTQNLAVIPGTGGVPVTTNNVNHLTNTQYYVNNSTNFLECLFSPALHVSECQLDGWTTPITALATVIPCSTYHIKLAIADVTDHFWDSAVFLRANSFNAGGTVAASPAYQQGLNSGLEGCANGAIRFERGNGDTSQPLTVNFSVSSASTAVSGVDYAPLTSPVVIPAGQTEILVPVTAFADGLTEGQETVVLLIDNSCQCQQATVEFLINDNVDFSVNAIQDTVICEGFSATLTAQPDGGIAPYEYNWSTSATTASITVTPSNTTLYTVTVTDGCGGTATDEVTVEVMPTLRDTTHVGLCPGGSINISGNMYTDAGIVSDTSYEFFICGKITTYIITLENPTTGSATVPFCAGESVVIGGNVYNMPGTVVDTLSTAAGCDSIVTYTLVELPISHGAETITFCPGTSVTIEGVVYSEDGVVIDTLTAASGCDSIVTYTLIKLPQPTRTEHISFCPGESVVLGGVTYNTSGTVTLTLPGTSACDTIVTYNLELLPQPTRSETISFCPGESVTLGGNAYTQPGTVVVTIPAATGCDTIATYTLQYLTPAPSHVNINCPHNVTVGLPSGVGETVVNYDMAIATTDCPCPGMQVTQTSGLASGSSFPLGVSQVCFRAQDACGNAQTCCLNITVQEDDPCDTKVIGCMKYELLTITQDQFKNKTYRVRVTNNCPDQLIYTAIQTPGGMVAMAPANNATYTAPGGNQYLVRNPNFSPFYSVRFKSINGGIHNGESDILRYTLPAQADVTFIHIISRLSIQQYYEAHMNTFYCPIGVTPAGEYKGERSDMTNIEDVSDMLVFPNPTEGTVQADLSFWNGEAVTLQVFNSQGQRVLIQHSVASTETELIQLPTGTADGLYILEVATENGERDVVKFIVKH